MDQVSAGITRFITEVTTDEVRMVNVKRVEVVIKEDGEMLAIATYRDKMDPEKIVAQIEEKGYHYDEKEGAWVK